MLKECLGSRAGAVLEAFETLAQARPAQPHYFLTMLGTDPVHFGRGVGQRLLWANLEQIDAADSPAYLEARDELVPLYERFGFTPANVPSSTYLEIRPGPTIAVSEVASGD